jgi:hypothetical protein
MGKKHEVLVGKGIRIERHGRFISFDTSRSKSEHKKIIAALASLRPTLEKRIPEKAEHLRKQLRCYNSFDIIANASFINLFVDPEKYKEYAHEGLQFIVEYITLLCLMNDFSEGENPLEQGPIDMQAIQNAAMEILNDTLLYMAAKRVDPKNLNPHTSLETFQYRSFCQNLVVRNPGYSHHQTEVLRNLYSFEPVKNWMRKSLSFEIEDIISFIEAVEKIMNGRISERRKQAINSEKQLRREVRLFRQGKLKDGECPEHILSEFAKLSEKKMFRKIKYLLTAWIFFGLGTTLSFTAEELAAESGKPVDICRKFLDCFSIGFGEVPQDFMWPNPTHPFRLRPIVHHNKRYLCPAPALLFWGARAALEELFNPELPKAVNKDVKLWQRYQKHRADYLVFEGMKLLSEILKHGESYHNLKYKFAEDGQLKEYDLDGLILYDKCAFLVEGKAGRLTEPAQRGAVDRMISDLKKLLVDSHEQATRAEKYISMSEEPVFILPDRQTLKIDKGNLKNFFLVSLTLDPLDTFTPVLYQVAELGIFGEGKLPWAVYLLDLKVITELIEFPSQFIHYLNRRLRINELASIEAYDELDWLGYYFLEGLYFEDIAKSGINRFRLLSYTTAMDEYFMYQTGERATPAPKPHQPMPALFKQIILELEDKHPLGYSEIICTLLDMDSKTLNRFTKWFERSRRNTKQYGKIHDFTFTLSDMETGITVMTCRDLHPKEFEGRLESYCQLKKYQLHRKRWVAIGSHVGLPGLVQFWGFADIPWEYDAEMEELIKVLPTEKTKDKTNSDNN